MTLLSPARLLASVLPARLRVVPPPSPHAASGPGPQGSGFRNGFSALAHRNYRLYIGGQVVSQVGSWMQSVSQPWLVLTLGGTPLQLASVLALQFLPPAFLAPLGGVLADRVDKRRALMAVQVLALAQAGTLFALVVTGNVQMWHIYVLAAVLGRANAVDMPLRHSFVAELVPPRDLMNAIALNSAAFNSARIIGPAVAGVLIAVVGLAWSFGINAISYFAVLAGLWLMVGSQLHRDVGVRQQPPVLRSLREGVHYATSTPIVLWPLVLLFGMATFGMNFQTLLPLLARDTLMLGADGYGALYAAMGVGSLFGSLSLAFLGNRRPLMPFMIGGGVAFVAFEIVFGMSRALPLVFGSAMLVGLFSMLMVNTINVTIQSNVNHALRGRIMSLYTTVFAGSAPVGGLLAGFMAETIGAPAAFIIGASAAGVFVVLVGWQLLRRFGLYRISAGTPVSEMDGPIPVIAPPALEGEPEGPVSAAS
jgi:MFS family permease